MLRCRYNEMPEDAIVGERKRMKSCESEREVLRVQRAESERDQSLSAPQNLNQARLPFVESLRDCSLSFGVLLPQR